jgi:hypothetical protein
MVGEAIWRQHLRMAAAGAAALPHVPQRPVHLLRRGSAWPRRMNALDCSKETAREGLECVL